MKEKLELMFKKLAQGYEIKPFVRLVLYDDFSGEVVHGLDDDCDNQLIEFDTGEFFSWLGEFTDPNAEKRKRLQSLVEQASDLDMEIRKLRDELYEDDNLPF